jgi:CRISPR-associated protein Csd1
MLQHQLAAVMKLILTYPQSEVRMNNETGKVQLADKGAAFLSGSLLAVLEEAQLAAANWKINTTIIDQFYSTASSAPCAVMGMLVSRVTSQHMPKLRKNMRGKYDKLEAVLESLHTEIDSKGGFPKILALKQQAEFSLGFYTQRAAFSRERPPRRIPQTNTQPLTEQGA